MGYADEAAQLRGRFLSLAISFPISFNNPLRQITEEMRMSETPSNQALK